MSKVLEYLEGLQEPARSTLLQLRKDLLELIPEPEEGFSYGMPVIKFQGRSVAGFEVFKNHLGYFPHSSLVTTKLAKELSAYKVSKGGFQFPHDHVLERSLVAKLVAARLAVLSEQYPDLFT